MSNVEQLVNEEDEKNTKYDLLELQRYLGYLLFCPKFLIFLVIVILLSLHHYRVSQHLKEIPSPPQIPFLGHILHYLDDTAVLSNLCDQLYRYGGMMRSAIGPFKPSIASANREFMQWFYQNSKYFTKSKYYNFLKPWLGEGLLTVADGLKWKKRRRALHFCFFQTSVLKSFFETFEKKSDILMDILSDIQDQEFNFHIYAKKFTLDVLLATTMSAEMNLQRNETPYFNAVETLCRVYSIRMVNFFKMYDMFYRFTGDRIKEKAALKVIDEFFEKTLSKKLSKTKDNEENDHKVDMLDMLMKVEVDGKSLTTAELREEINTFAFAGFDTTASCLALTLYEIGANPEVQEKLYEEQKTIFKGNVKNPKVTYEIFPEMTYLDLVLKESLRRYAIVPAVGKRVTQDIKFGDIIFPERLNIGIMTYALHLHPEYYKDPQKFIPERFEDKAMLDPTIYVPFGVKPRECIGQRFALLELKSTISKIVRNFEIINIPEHKLVLYHSLTLQSKTGICIKLKKRE